MEPRPKRIKLSICRRASRGKGLRGVQWLEQAFADAQIGGDSADYGVRRGDVV